MPAWDNTIAILTGDFLFAHASGLVAELGPDAVRIMPRRSPAGQGQIRETVGACGPECDPSATISGGRGQDRSLIATSPGTPPCSVAPRQR